MRLRVGALATSEDEGEKMCREMIEKVKASPVGKHIYAIDAENVEQVAIRALIERKITLSVAESCTGGMLGKCITDVSGASSVFSGGVITYSNEAKMKHLGVKVETLEKYSAVSPEVAIEMADGVRSIFDSDIALSVTGEAGPEASTKNAVGTVFIGVSTHEKSYAVSLQISSRRNREYIRRVACSRALREVLKLINYYC